MTSPTEPDPNHAPEPERIQDLQQDETTHDATAPEITVRTPQLWDMVGYIPGNSELNPMAVRLDRDTRELWIDHVGAPADPRHRPAWTWMLPVPATPEYATRLLDRLRNDAATVIASSTVDDSGRIRVVGSDGWAAYGRIHAAAAQEAPTEMDDVLTPARALHMIERVDDKDLLYQQSHERLWQLNEMTLLDVTQPDPARYAHHQQVKQARWAAAEEQLKVMLEQHHDTQTGPMTPLTTEQLATHRAELDQHISGLQRDIAAAAETAMNTYLRAREIGLDQPSATSEVHASDAHETRRRLAAELPAITAADIAAAPEHRRTLTAHVAARQRAVRQLEHAREHVSQDAASMLIENIDQHGLSEIQARRDIENDVLVASSTAVEIAKDDLATELDQAHGLTVDLGSTIPDHPKLVEEYRDPRRDSYIKGAQDPEWAELNWDNNIAPALDARAEFIDEYADPEATAREALEEQREEQRQRREIAQVDAEETRLIETYGDPRQGPKGPRTTATKIADRVRHATDRIVHLRSAEEQTQADRAREDHYLSLDQIQHGEHGLERAD